MACSSCGRDNRAGARFCDHCGTRLAAAPAPRAVAAYTPQHLAQKILRQRSALEGERKQVTVLFADIKSSLELAAEVDPEAWHSLLDRFFAVLADGVHRYEGTVNQYTGDGIMALFGAPIAHEDHAQRACYAALRLTRELRAYAQQLRRERGLDFHVRMGLNSGEVVVGRIGDDLRMDYTAQGHTVGLASRMEQLAEAGRAYLTESTAALVAGYFALEDLGEFRIKGVAEPVRAFALEGRGSARTRLEVARTRGLSRFVGRARDLERIEKALESAVAGRGQVVAIAGGAGVGKSRLCLELTERCRARGLEVHTAHGLSHAQSIPYLPVLQYLRDAFEIDDTDSALRARQRIAGALLLIDPELADDLPLIFDFLGVADAANPPPRLEGEGRQRRLAAVLARFHQGRATQAPLVIVLEDLHWFDRGSRGFVAFLAGSLAELRALLVVNFRPEFEADWLADPGVETISLGPLGPAELEELLRDLLGDDPSIAPLASRIREQARGNPFFAEELVQSLVDSGALVGARGGYRMTRPVAELAIPSSIQALVSSRIDRLTEPEKQVLQTAAVVGKSFPEPVLRKVVDLPEETFADALRGLAAADFIHERAIEPAPVYEFHHPITQEVAYQSQLSEQRVRVHAAIARALEENAASESEDEDAAVVAHHWERAGNAFAAARWTHRAARWIGTSNPAEAIAMWRKLLALIESAPETAEAAFLGARACRWLLFLGAFQGLPESEAEALFRDGKAYSEATRDRRSLAVTIGNYGAYQAQVAGRPQPYVEHAEQAFRIAEGAGRRSELAASVRLVQAYHMAGRFSEAVERGEPALERFESRDAPRTDPLDHVTLFASTGDSLVELGRLDLAAARIERGLRFAEQHDLLLNAGSCHNVCARLAAMMGQAERAESHARAAHRIAEKTGNRAQQVYASDCLGLAHQANGRWSEAVAAGERGIATSERFGVGLIADNAHRAHLAMSYLALGDLRRAGEMAEAAVAASGRCGPRYTPRAHLARAAVRLAADGLRVRAAVEADLDAADAAVAATEARVYVPFLIEERARLATLAGEAGRRDALLREARSAYRGLGMRVHAERIDLELHRSV